MPLGIFAFKSKPKNHSEKNLRHAPVINDDGQYPSTEKLGNVVN